MKKILSALLCISLIFASATSGLTVSAVAETDEEAITLIACSDFQHPDGNDAGKALVGRIINVMKDDGVTDTDGFLFCGDYDIDTIGNKSQTQDGVNALLEAISPLTPEHKVMGRGNHDPAGVTGISASGNNDPESGKYGVFLINEPDYMWYGRDEETIKRTAQKLTNYLNDKIDDDFNKPIFILSHLPLHYTMRTREIGDGRYARYLFDVINKAGEKGLNIYFLYGHNHGDGFEDYMGGSSVFKKAGDDIVIAEYSKTDLRHHTLNFNYMNAGYVGYYKGVNEGSDRTLNMTKFVITGNDVTVTRYDETGIHNLKSKGVRNSYKGETYYDPYEDVYTSPQTIALSGINDYTAIADTVPQLNSNGNTYVRINELSELEDGDQYIIAYNGTQIVTPNIITKTTESGTSKTGFELMTNEFFGEDAAYGNLSGVEWTFTRSGKEWYIGKDGLKLNLSAAPTLDQSGSLFKISKTYNGFKISNGAHSFKYDSVGLINGNGLSSSDFEIYKLVGYPIKVYGAVAQNENGKSVTNAAVGDVITLSANKVSNGKVFDKWVVSGAEIDISDVGSSTATFVMPEEKVRISAEYSVLKGDTNADATVNSLDMLQLQMSILGTYDSDDISVYDLNGDGKVTSADIVILQSFILGLSELV